MEESLKLKINNICSLLGSRDYESKILGLGIILEELPDSVLNKHFDVRYLTFLSQYSHTLFYKYKYVVTLKQMIEEALNIYCSYGYTAKVDNIICQIFHILGK